MRGCVVLIVGLLVATAGGQVQAQPSGPEGCLAPAAVAALQSPADAWKYYPLGTMLTRAQCVKREGDALLRITWPEGGAGMTRRIGAHWYDIQYSGTDMVDFRQYNYAAGTPRTAASWVVLNVGSGWLIFTRYQPGYYISMGDSRARTEFSFQFCDRLEACRSAGTNATVYLLAHPTPVKPFYDWRNPKGFDWYDTFALVERYQDAMNDFYPYLDRPR